MDAPHLKQNMLYPLSRISWIFVATYFIRAQKAIG